MQLRYNDEIHQENHAPEFFKPLRFAGPLLENPIPFVTAARDRGSDLLGDPKKTPEFP
jgi:hypothetical protein